MNSAADQTIQEVNLLVVADFVPQSSEPCQLIGSLEGVVQTLKYEETLIPVVRVLVGGAFRDLRVPQRSPATLGLGSWIQGVFLKPAGSFESWILHPDSLVLGIQESNYSTKP